MIVISGVFLLSVTQPAIVLGEHLIVVIIVHRNAYDSVIRSVVVTATFILIALVDGHRADIIAHGDNILRRYSFYPL